MAPTDHRPILGRAAANIGMTTSLVAAVKALRRIPTPTAVGPSLGRGRPAGGPEALPVSRGAPSCSARAAGGLDGRSSLGNAGGVVLTLARELSMDRDVAPGRIARFVAAGRNRPWPGAGTLMAANRRSNSRSVAPLVHLDPSLTRGAQVLDGTPDRRRLQVRLVRDTGQPSRT